MNDSPAPAPTPNPSTETCDFTVAPAKYCLGCGADLTEVEDPLCPHCLRAFDPADPTTCRDTPIPQVEAKWSDREKLALYSLPILYLCGQLVLNSTGGNFDRGDRNVIGALVLTLSVPWLIAITYLSLLALGNKLNPKLSLTIPLATALAILYAIGAPTLILGAAFLLGPFTGLLFTWRHED